MKKDPQGSFFFLTPRATATHDGRTGGQLLQAGAESERLVQAALEQLMQNRTTLIIAHRLATVRKVDRIVVLDEGRIVASGRHDALMTEGGLYARLAALQFRDALGA